VAARCINKLGGEGRRLSAGLILRDVLPSEVLLRMREQVPHGVVRSGRSSRLEPRGPSAHHIHHSQGIASLAFDSYLSIDLPFCIVSPMSSRPLSRQCLRWASISNVTTPPSGPRISCFSRSTVSVALAPRSASSNSFSRSSGEALTGRMPFLKQVL